MTAPRFTHWHLIRHAPVAAHQGALYREADMSADLGDRQALDWIAAHLPRDANWWASPRKRTVETALALQDSLSLHLPIWEDRRLMEQDFGNWQGLDFDRLWPKIEDLPAHNWSLLAADSRPPGGESFRDLWARVGDFMAEHGSGARQQAGGAGLPEKYVPEKYVVVAHAGTIRAFIGRALGLDPERALALDLRPLSLSQLLHQTGDGRGGRWQLLSLNRMRAPQKARTVTADPEKPAR